MPNFSYVVRDRAGKKIVSIQQAGSKEELITRLQNQGFLIIDIQAAQDSSAILLKKSRKRKQFTHNGIRSYDLVLLARQLSVVLEAGITLTKGLDIICKQTESLRLSLVVDQIKKDVESGSMLRAALSKHPRVFSELWINLVDTGEASGNLAMILGRLAYYLETELSFRRKVVSALIYPSVLLVVATATVSFFMLKIIPTFVMIFQGFNMQLPALTSILVKISALFRKLFLFIIIGIVIAIISIKQGSRNPSFKKKMDAFKFKIPVFGKFLKVIVTERFASEVSILIESGVPLLYALDIAERSTGNLVMQEVIAKLKENVKEGKSLSSLMEESDFFSPLLVQMVLVGEETGELPGMFKKVAAFYQELVETFIVRFINLFEPAMIVIMGMIVGVVVVAMFLPIFNLATAIR